MPIGNHESPETRQCLPNAGSGSVLGEAGPVSASWSTRRVTRLSVCRPGNDGVGSAVCQSDEDDRCRGARRRQHRRRAGGRRGAPASWRVARLVGHRGVGRHRWDRHRLGRRGRGDRIDSRRPDCQVHDPRPTVARRRGSRTARWSSAGWWPLSGSSSFLSWECSSASSLASTRRSCSGSVHGRRGRRPRPPCAPWVFRRCSS